MKERPILFSSPMVKALLGGRKTQTRRVVDRVATLGPVTEFQPSTTPGYDWIMRDRRLLWNDICHADLLERCPHGGVGDRLWVRETFQGPLFDYGRMEEYMRDRQQFEKPEFCVYAADGGDAPEFVDADDNHRCAWRPSIHMPRWACRILLEITNVRVQRLQEISTSDAIAEGIPALNCSDSTRTRFMEEHVVSPEIAEFVGLWDSINPVLGSFASNPWVWAITFRRIDA